MCFHTKFLSQSQNIEETTASVTSGSNSQVVEYKTAAVVSPELPAKGEN